MRVLIVEDNDLLRRILARLLRRAGCEVCEAPDAPVALGGVLGFHPDLILTDVMMPEMDGIEMIRRMRATAGTAQVPIVVISADDTPETVGLAREAGASEYLVKPVDGASLLGVVRHYIEAAQGRV